jgi:predicted RNase H-like nuclease (RuvC/YqgF family)
MDSNQLDFKNAREYHLRFKSRIRSLLYGEAGGDEVVPSHFECALGKWIYSNALKTYGHIPEMQDLERLHTEVHNSAKEVVTLFKYGKVDESRIAFNSLEKLSDQLSDVSLLLEKKIGQHDAKATDNLRPGNGDSDQLVQEMKKKNRELEKENSSLKKKIEELEKKLKK